MCVCLVQHWINLLNVFQSVERNLSVGFSVGGMLFAGLNHVLGGFGVFNYLCHHSSSILHLCNAATYACVL